MKPVTVSSSVARPAEDVHDFLLVLANHEQFLDHYLVDWEFSGPRSGVGARGRARTDAPAGQDWTDFEIVEAEPSRIVEDAVGAGGKRRTRGTYRLEPLAEGGTEGVFEMEWLQASKPNASRPG